MLELDFGDMSEKLKEEYFDVYKEIQSEILSSTRFDENSDLSTTYLGRVDTTRDSKIRAKEPLPISEHGYTVGKLLDGTSDIIRYRSTLFALYITSFITKICIQNTENSSRKWTIH